MKIKYIALDCYGTLFEEKSIFENTFKYIANNYGVDKDLVKCTFSLVREVINRHLKHNYFMSQRQRYGLIFDLIRINLKINDFRLESVIDFLMKQFATVAIFPETLLIIMTLKKSFKVVLFANADNDTITELLQANNLIFDNIITSESAKAYKPNSKYFQFLIGELNCNREDIIFVGNDLRQDVIGGLDFGIYSIWLNSADTVEQSNDETVLQNVQVINKLSELLTLLKEITK